MHLNLNKFYKFIFKINIENLYLKIKYRVKIKKKIYDKIYLNQVFGNFVGYLFQSYTYNYFEVGKI